MSLLITFNSFYNLVPVSSYGLIEQFQFNPIGPNVYFEHFEKLRFLKKINDKNYFLTLVAI